MSYYRKLIQQRRLDTKRRRRLASLIQKRHLTAFAAEIVQQPSWNRRRGVENRIAATNNDGEA